MTHLRCTQNFTISGCDPIVCYASVLINKPYYTVYSHLIILFSFSSKQEENPREYTPQDDGDLASHSAGNNLIVQSVVMPEVLLDDDLFDESAKTGGGEKSKLPSALAESRRKLSAALGLTTASKSSTADYRRDDERQTAGEGVVVVVFYTLAFLHSLVGLSQVAPALLPTLIVVCMISLILLK